MDPSASLIRILHEQRNVRDVRKVVAGHGPAALARTETHTVIRDDDDHRSLVTTRSVECANYLSDHTVHVPDLQKMPLIVLKNSQGWSAAHRSLDRPSIWPPLYWAPDGKNTSMVREEAFDGCTEGPRRYCCARTRPAAPQLVHLVMYREVHRRNPSVNVFGQRLGEDPRYEQLDAVVEEPVARAECRSLLSRANLPRTQSREVLLNVQRVGATKQREEIVGVVPEKWNDAGAPYQSAEYGWNRVGRRVVHRRCIAIPGALARKPREVRIPEAWSSDPFSSHQRAGRHLVENDQDDGGRGCDPNGSSFGTPSQGRQALNEPDQAEHREHNRVSDEQAHGPPAGVRDEACYDEHCQEADGECQRRVE